MAAKGWKMKIRRPSLSTLIFLFRCVQAQSRAAMSTDRADPRLRRQ